MVSVLVTGSDGGIGSAIVTALKNAGCSVLTTSSTDTDLADPTAVHALRERIGSVDWIVCAHGFIDTETVLEQQTTEAIETTFEVNTLSLFWLAREFLPTLGKGMVMLSSAAGLSPNGRFAAYSASKSAVNAFTQALARSRPEQKFFAVCPGPTNTAMREKIAGDADKMQSPDVIAAVVSSLLNETTDHKSGDLILVRDGVVSISARV